MQEKNIKLTKEQKQVLVDIFSWLKSPNEPLKVGGYAGTGKTMLLAVWRKIVKKAAPKKKVAFVAYTGKASRVLESYLQLYKVRYPQDNVSTIHSLIYAPITNSSGSVTGWRRKSKIDYDLIVIDEASMVDAFLWQDLTAFKVPILAVGDHGQLPPIGGNFSLMSTPDLKLETIHRQERDNPIIKLSMMARKEGEVPVGDYGNRVRKLNRYDSASGQEVEEILRSYNEELLVLTGYNHSRIQLNQQIREYRQMGGPRPKTGDVVICLKNNWEKHIYNGMVGTVQRIIPKEEERVLHWYEVELSLEQGEVFYEGIISAHQFNHPSTLEKVEGLEPQAIGDLFDFGHALTVHKAQGSQAQRVLLFEERNRHMSDDDWRRWLYTGITRAEEELTLVGRE